MANYATVCIRFVVRIEELILDKKVKAKYKYLSAHDLNAQIMAQRATARPRALAPWIGLQWIAKPDQLHTAAKDTGRERDKKKRERSPAPQAYN